MLYLVSEDRNSGLYFWDTVAKTFKGEEKYRIAGDKITGGNKNIENVFNTIKSKLEEGDQVFIILDQIVDSDDNIRIRNILRRIRRECTSRKVGVKVTSYYCFEELYLSYDEVIDMYSKCYKVKNEVMIALNYVNNKINKAEDYYISDEEIRGFVQSVNSKITNRERLAAALLNEVTIRLTNGLFRINKSENTLAKSGKCWLEDCTKIMESMRSKESEKCIRCEYECKMQNTKNKLIDLERRSLCRSRKISLQEI